MERMLRFYSEVVRDDESEPGFAPEMAVAHYRLYGLIRDVLHDGPRAELSLERALVIWDQLAVRNPDNPKTLSSLAFSLIRVGELHERRANPVLAEASCRRSLEIYERVARDFPSRVDLELPRRPVRCAGQSGPRAGARRSFPGR
jgi:hypothetical protein